ATSGAGARFDPAHPFGGGKIIFDRRRPPDTEPPAITILQDPTSPGAGEKVTLAITATDGSGPPNVLVSLESFSPLDGTPILLPDGSDRWALYFDRPGKVVIKVSATDTFGNQRERIHPVTIGQ